MWIGWKDQRGDIQCFHCFNQDVITGGRGRNNTEATSSVHMPRCMLYEDIFRLGDLDLWPMTLTLKPDLDIILHVLHAKIQVRQTNRQTMPKLWKLSISEEDTCPVRPHQCSEKLSGPHYCDKSCSCSCHVGYWQSSDFECIKGMIVQFNRELRVRLLWNIHVF